MISNSKTGDIKTAIEYVRDILAHEMSINGLPIDGGRVALWNQKFKIPSDEAAFILVRHVGAPVMMSNRVAQEETTDGLKDVQDINLQERIAVSIFSRNMDAMRNFIMIPFSLAGTYSQQMQEANSFKIGRISPVEELSGLEGAGMLFRFEMTFNVNAWYQVEKDIDFYDSFRVQVNDEGIKKEFELSTP